MLAVAGVTSVGAAQSWDGADAFAADSVRPVRRIAMLLGAVGLGVVVAATPMLVVRVAGTAGFPWVAGWIGFAFGATLFAMAPRTDGDPDAGSGRLARIGAVSPQQVVDRLTRQVPIVTAFRRRESDVPVVGAHRRGPGPWRSVSHLGGWVVVLTALAGWLSFLHVPVFQRVASPLWPLGVALLGVLVVRSGGRAS